MVQRRAKAGAPDDGVDFALPTILPYDSISGHAGEGANRAEDPAIAGVPDRRHHHDIPDPAHRLCARPCFQASRSSFEQHASVDIAGEEERVPESYPGGIRDLGQLGQDLRAAVAPANDEDCLAREVVWRAIMG